MKKKIESSQAFQNQDFVYIDRGAECHLNQKKLHVNYIL